MAWTKVIDGSTVEILLDDRGADVGGARNRRRISELLPDGTHRGGDRSLRRSLRLLHALLRQHDRRRQRAAPRAEILCRELITHVLTDELVQLSAVEVAGFPVQHIAQAR